jgi:hypothetical protein
MNAFVFLGLISLVASASLPRPQIKENDICYVCPALIEMIEALVKDDPSLLTTLETDATAFCEKLPIPATYKAYCQKFVDAALPDLIKALENDLPPSKVCADAFGCTSGMNAIPMALLSKSKSSINSIPLTKLTRPSYKSIPMVKLNKAVPSSAVGGLACDGCEALLKVIDNQLSDATFQNEIMQELLTVCKSVPSQYQSQCSALVNQYGSQLLKAAATELNPTTACTALNLCSAQTKLNVFMSLIGTQATGDVLCSPCKYAAQEAATYLKQYLPQLLVQLNGVCTVLPADLQSDCKLYITKYGQTIIDQIVSNPNLPTEACTYAGLCGTTVQISYKKCIGNQNCNRKYNSIAIRNNQIAKAIFNRPQNKEAVLCEMCDVFFGYIAKELNSTQIVMGITDAVDLACAVFPDNMQAGCEQLVGTYIPMALADAAAALNPNTLCTQLKACP